MVCSKLTDWNGMNCYDYDFFFLRKRKESWTQSAAAFEPMGGFTGRICMCRQGCTCITTGHLHVFSHTRKHDCHAEAILKTCDEAANSMYRSNYELNPSKNRSREYFTTTYRHTYSASILLRKFRIRKFFPLVISCKRLLYSIFKQKTAIQAAPGKHFWISPISAQ